MARSRKRRRTRACLARGANVGQSRGHPLGYASRVKRVALVLLAALFAPSVAFAQTATDKQLAQSLFDEARTLVQKRDLGRACPMFAESQRLDPGGGTLLNLAVCHEQEGKVATAWQELNHALSVAMRDGRKDREQTAREHLEAVTPRLPKLTLVPPAEAVVGLHVEVDGASLGAAALGVPVPLDPGRHRANAGAPGRTPWAWEGALAEGERLELLLPALAVAQPDQVSVVPAPLPTAIVVEKKTLSTASYVAGGVAVGALIGAAVTGLVALERQSTYKHLCATDRNYCPDPAGKDAASSARTFAWISTAALATGIGAAVIAVILPRKNVPPPVAVVPLGQGLVVTFSLTL